jgi:exopolyphosphatase / guanosine-5'-triphosphate,3'-diphosphate pyrophosphatase
MADNRAPGAVGPRGPVPQRRRRRRRSRGPWRRGPGTAAVASPQETFYAALDLGTNNCRLLVASPTADSFRVVDAFSRIVRLGEGLSINGVLSEAAMTRAIGALKVCAAKIASRRGKPIRTRLIATEACRSAKNGSDFLEKVRSETGLQLEIIGRETEARLAAHGCASLLDLDASGAVLFDIGGGSSELAWLGRAEAVDRGPPVADVQEWDSMPMGVVTLAEKYGGKDVSAEVFNAMINEALPLVRKFAEKAGVNGNGIHLLGTSGTVTTVAGLYLKLPRYDRQRVDGIWLEAGAVNDVLGWLKASSYADRVAHPCIGQERADLVLAGCAILEAIRIVFPCERLRVADRGLREGMLIELMRADGAWAQPQ